MCLCVSVHLCDFFFFFFLRGLWKQVLKKCQCGHFDLCLLRIWRLCAPSRQNSVRAAYPNETCSPCSLWPDLTLSASGGHTLMCEHRSLCPDLKGRWSFLHGRSCKGTSLWFLQGPTTSVFTWSISMKAYRASCVRWWQVWIYTFKPGSHFWRWKTTSWTHTIFMRSTCWLNAHMSFPVARGLLIKTATNTLFDGIPKVARDHGSRCLHS